MASITMRSTRMAIAAAAAGRHATPVCLTPRSALLPACSKIPTRATLPATPAPAPQWAPGSAASFSGRAQHSSSRSVATAAAAAEAPSGGLTFESVTAALTEVHKAWESSDGDKNGKLSLDEACTLLASPELQHAATTMTRLPLDQLVPPTRAEIEQLYKSADHDKSGSLSHMEFLALFLATTTKTIKSNPIVLAEAVMYMVDKDKNGKIDGKEMKGLLGMFGVPGLLLMPIPDFLSVDYKPILKTVASALGHK